jgi:hypothetical protein
MFLFCLKVNKFRTQYERIIPYRGGYVQLEIQATWLWQNRDLEERGKEILKGFPPTPLLDQLGVSNYKIFLEKLGN